ncbi:MAG: UDP-N-acetylmuramoyl-L-alanyl-D-glutamate--2,6-diaminopimelate ligase [Clostridia bacterium]|nr:UDP-N-acetylmuramoyl-L-alanyl-D-glutamate--2,6-diaminopimelate ligase [Clostridia bacterium]
MKISELLPNAVIPDEAAMIEPSKLSSRTEDIARGTLFFLTEGIAYDKRRLLPYILAKRPLAIVVPTDTKALGYNIPIIYAENVRRAYAEALFRFYGLEKTKMKFIAITGTNGKTTTATMLWEILRRNGLHAGLIGTGKILLDDNTLSAPYYSMTTPDPEILYPALAEMDTRGCQFVVMEASSHALALEKLTPLFFDAAIFTNLSAEHLDFHKSMENYYRSKARLFEKTRLAILNNDDSYARRLSEECNCETLRVGALYPGEVAAKNIEGSGLGGCSYMYTSNGPKFFVHLAIPGIYQIYNSMLALSAAISLGIAPCKAKKALESITEIPGRLHLVSQTDISVYVDYAHTPEALLSSLKEANASKESGQRIWLIFGCGGERDREKRPKMAEIAEKNADSVILTLDNCRGESPMQILKDTVAGFRNKKSVRVISDRKKAIRHAILAMQRADTLIIAGKGHEVYTIDKTGYHPFDERKIILDALKERKGGHTVLYENQADNTHLRQGN